MILREEKNTTEIDQELRKVSHWAKAIDRVFTGSKEFAGVLYDFAEENIQNSKAVVNKLDDVQKRLRAIYNELEDMEEKLLER